VAGALADVGATLLIDEAAWWRPGGPVQILGIDFHFRDRARCTRAVCEAYPRIPGHMRLVLLHDRGPLRTCPTGGRSGLLGHTHGGQLGLLSWDFPIPS